MARPRKNDNSLVILAIPAGVVFIFLMFSSTVKPYGFFIDELYFISCSKHLAWGFIDQPPLSIALLTFMTKIFGTNMLAIRFLPALSIAGTVYITGLIARELGGKLPGMLLASAGVMILPVFLIFGSFYSMNAYEPLIWTCVILFVVKMIRGNTPRYWLQIGILMGLGLEMKHTIALYGIALLIGFILTKKRKLLFNRYTLFGGMACFLILLPNLLWQYFHDFPSLELYANSFSSKNIYKSYLQVIIEQIVFANPITFPLWFVGLVFLLFPKGKPFRLLFFTYVFLLLVMLAGHSSRPDRIMAIYTFFMASGAVAVENYLIPRKKQFVLYIYLFIILTVGAILAPLFTPVLPPNLLKPYIARLGIHFDLEKGKMGEPIPQWLADRIGWEELTSEVSKVYRELPEKEKLNTVIISTNYGPAGAIDLYGPKYGLSKVYATHNSFHSWGPPPDTVKTYIGVYIDINDAGPRFESAEKASVYHCPDCTRPQQNVPIYILRKPKFSMSKEWINFKNYH